MSSRMSKYLLEVRKLREIDVQTIVLKIYEFCESIRFLPTFIDVYSSILLNTYFSAIND